MQQNNYLLYTAEDFLNDDDFIRSVKYGSPNDLLFWEAYEKSAPANLADFLSAKKDLQLILTATRIALPELFAAGLLADINASIDQHHHKESKIKVLYRTIGAVAAIFFLAVLGIWVSTASVTVSTAYGEKKNVNLPDGSVVMLNANSEISYPLLWKIYQKRNVKLKGEAYFKVVHLNTDPNNIIEKDRFRVQTEHLHVEVLGTEFNVKDRHQDAKVVLTKGSVNVWSVATGHHFILKPDQMAMESKKKPLKVIETNPIVERAWTEGNMKMEKTTVKLVLQEFEDTYGYKVELGKPEMANVKIDGTISFKSEESVLFVLSNILNANIKKEGKTIRLEARK